MNERYGQAAIPSWDKEPFGPSNGIEVRPTICSICNPGSHCGLDAYVSNGRIIKLQGSEETHNAGTLCAKGAAGLQYLYHPDRVKTPLVRTGPRGSGRFKPASWQDALNTDTARLADVVLPACTSYERSELKFYPEKRIRWTQPAVAPLGQSRSDANIIFDLAAFLAPDDDLLGAGHEAAVDWMLQPSGLKVSDLKKYPRGLVIENVAPIPYRKYENEGFNTPSGKMEFTSLVLAEHGLEPLPVYREPLLSPVSALKEAKNFPLILTTRARLPFFIHSRAYRIPRLLSFQPDPMADLNPADARPRGLNQGDWVLVSTRRGAVRVQASLTETVMPGVVNIYHGRPEADVNSLIDPDYRDSISGFPGFKSLLCEVQKC